MVVIIIVVMNHYNSCLQTEHPLVVEEVVMYFGVSLSPSGEADFSLK